VAPRYREASTHGFWLTACSQPCSSDSGAPGCGGALPVRGEVVPRRERVAAVRGAWMQAASCGVISFFTLSRSMGKIFCTNASSCCLNSSAGYLASTCKGHHGFRLTGIAST